MGNKDAAGMVEKATMVERRWLFTRPLEGMVIGAVDGIVITADMPHDYSQWKDGKPWHIK